MFFGNPRTPNPSKFAIDHSLKFRITGYKNNEKIRNFNSRNSDTFSSKPVEKTTKVDLKIAKLTGSATTNCKTFDKEYEISEFGAVQKGAKDAPNRVY